MEKYNFSNMNQQFQQTENQQQQAYFYPNDFSNYYYTYQNQFQYPHFAYQNLNYQQAYASPLNCSTSSSDNSTNSVSVLSSSSPQLSSSRTTDQSLTSPQLNTYSYQTNKSTESTDRSENSSPDLKTLSTDETEGGVKRETRSKRRTRTQFSKQQIDCLEAIFNKSHYPEVHVVDRLSDKLGLSIERISVWFQNRRAKFKKTKKPSSSVSSADSVSSSSYTDESSLQFSNSNLNNKQILSNFNETTASNSNFLTTKIASNNIINPLVSANNYSYSAINRESWTY